MMRRYTQLARGGLGTVLTVLVLASMGVRPHRVAALVLDDFTDGVATKTERGLELQTNGSLARDDGRALHGVLGGRRQVILRMDSGAGASEACTLAIDPTGKGLAYSSTGRADGAFELIYNGAGRGLRADLSSAQGIRVVVNADESSVPYTVTLTLRGSSRRSFTTTQTVTRSGEQQVALPFGAGGHLNMKTIEQVRLIIDPPVAADLVVSRLETFPAGAAGR